MDKYYGFGLPINISAHGGEIDKLIRIFHVFMLVLFVGWLIYFVIALVQFRAKKDSKALYHNKHYKLPTWIEVFVALFEAFLLVGFSFPIFHQFRFDMPKASESVVIRVVAEQFAWNIHYAGKDGQFGESMPKLISTENPIGLDQNDPAAKDDITTINQLNIPVNKPIIVQLSSKDVIHSFALPVMRVKQDTIPGQQIPVTFEAIDTGKFEIACAQLCGLGHYRMRGFFNVMTQSEFDKWIDSQTPKQEDASE